MKLIDRLPKEFGHGEFHRTRAWKMRDVEIVKEHDGTEVAWIGPHKHVYVWFELANGYAIGWNENPSRGWSFPVVRIKQTKIPSKKEVLWALKNPDTVEAMEINNRLTWHKDWNSSKVMHRCPLCGYETDATNIHRHCSEAPINPNAPKTLPEYLRHMSVLMYVVTE